MHFRTTTKHKPRWRFFALLGQDSRGVSNVEYIILVGLVALLAIGAFRKFSGAITQATHSQGDKVSRLEGSEGPDTSGSQRGATLGAAQNGRSTSRGSTSGNSASGDSTSGDSTSGGTGLGLRPTAPARRPVAAVPAANNPENPAGLVAPGPAPGEAAPATAAGPPPPPAGAPTPDAPSSPSLGRKLTEIAAGGALGAAQAVTPGGALANALPTPSRYTEFGRGITELGIGVLQVAGGLGEMGGGGLLATAGVVGAPETAGLSLGATVGGGALATAGAATAAQGASNIVGSVASIYRAVTMSDEPGPAAKPQPEQPPKSEPTPKPQAEPEVPSQPKTASPPPINKAGKPYPTVTDLKTGKPIPFPEGKLTQVPKAERVSWTNTDRGKFIKEWYDRGYSTPEGGWAKYDIHHIKPREFGGNNAFDNLTPVLREVHTKIVTPWWNGI